MHIEFDIPDKTMERVKYIGARVLLLLLIGFMFVLNVVRYSLFNVYFIRYFFLPLTLLMTNLLFMRFYLKNEKRFWIFPTILGLLFSAVLIYDFVIKHNFDKNIFKDEQVYLSLTRTAFQLFYCLLLSVGGSKIYLKWRKRK